MNSKLSAFLLGLSFAAVYVLGCATAPMIEPRASAQEAPPGVQRWEYLKINHGWDGGRWASEAGAQGWELVQYGPGDQQVFKRPLAAR